VAAWDLKSEGVWGTAGAGFARRREGKRGGCHTWDGKGQRAGSRRGGEGARGPRHHTTWGAGEVGRWLWDEEDRGSAFGNDNFFLILTEIVDEESLLISAFRAHVSPAYGWLRAILAASWSFR
jgi:hypothetical protein